MSVFWQYFGVPSGAIWSNVLAEPVIAALTGAVVYAARHRIGRTLAAWWAKHHGPHAIEHHLEALRQHEEAKRG